MDHITYYFLKERKGALQLYLDFKLFSSDHPILEVPSRRSHVGMIKVKQYGPNQLCRNHSTFPSYEVWTLMEKIKVRDVKEPRNVTYFGDFFFLIIFNTLISAFLDKKHLNKDAPWTEITN